VRGEYRCYSSVCWMVYWRMDETSCCDAGGGGSTGSAVSYLPFLSIPTPRLTCLFMSIPNPTNEQPSSHIFSYKDKVKDYNFGSLIRTDARDEYGEKNTIFGVFTSLSLH